MRVGIGYDIHRLIEGKKLMLGGVKIPCEKGAEAHSDGDVLIHAVIDAFLGAMGAEDIGMRFPDIDPEFKDASSMDLLKEVVGLMEKNRFKIINVDTVVIVESPKISEHKSAIKDRMALTLKIPASRINVKGKTSERIGPVGTGDAIESYAVVLLEEVVDIKMGAEK